VPPAGLGIRRDLPSTTRPTGPPTGAHSTGTGEYGLDLVVDAEAAGEGLVPGDLVEVSTPGGTVDHTVERTERYAEDELAGAAEVWESVPGRLVLITCFQRAGRASTENLVVVAQS
jgi:hypothetical protein